VAASFRSRVLSPAGLTAAVGLLVIATVAVIGPIVWGDAAGATNVPDRLQTASPEHPFGTDELGRDVLARVLVATRLSVLLALGATAISAVGGILLGLIPTVLPPRPRRLITGLIDILLAFPWLLLALFFSVIWGASSTGAMLAVGFAGIPGFARLTYTLASSIMGRDYVRAARIVGIGPLGVLWRHVLPNASPALLVNVAVSAAGALLAFAALSFLGLGVQPPEFDWGRLLREGIVRIYVNPLAAIGPGIPIVIAGLVFTLTGEFFAASPRRGVLLRRRRGLRPSSSAAHAVPALRPTGTDLPADAVPADAVSAARDLRIAFPDANGERVERVHGIELGIRPGEVVGIVGESGSGKSITAMALAALIESPGEVTATTLRFRGIDLLRPIDRSAAKQLGIELSMVFQDPLTSLNPSLTIGRQLTEAARVHQGLSRAAADARAIEALESVGIPEPAKRMRQYPHQLSGGQRQRAMIAMGLMGQPKLVIADEPTTALDVTVQRQVLATLKRAQTLTDAAILFISHDIALVSGLCDRILVMKGGHIVEDLPADRLLQDARHPYTRALIACVPDMASDRTVPLPVIGDLDTSTIEELRR
jgi:peptide/nickel transport system permease protein